MGIELLTFTTLFPNAVQTRHGIFVEQRLRHLRATGEVGVRVVAPIPWFPSSRSVFGKYATFARVPATEERHGVPVYHPRYPVIPKIGLGVAADLMAAATARAVHAHLKSGPPVDVLDAHFFYPDGVAAVRLGRRFGLPVVITARGTDINLYPSFARPRKLILWAAEHAAGIVTVCRALKDRLVELGVQADKIRVLRNGVDLQQFRPLDRDRCREQLGWRGTVLLSVGHLIERKGNHLAIQALARLPDVRLAFAGDGEEQSRLRRLAMDTGVADRVEFLGHVEQADLARYYCAADALILASSREGWANVLLESMACGTPVVASRVWGTPEVVAAPEAGVLMRSRDAEGIVRAVTELFDAYPDRAMTRRYAEGFSWDSTSQGQLELFAAVRECGAERRR